MIVLTSSGDHSWPWSAAADELVAEALFAESYPALHRHMKGFEDRLRTRQDQGRFWWELPLVLRSPFDLDEEGWVAAVRAARGRSRPLSAAALRATRDEYQASVAPVRALQAEVLRLERRLADLVNAAYGLSPADVDLLWRTAPPRMPVGAPPETT